MRVFASHPIARGNGLNIRFISHIVPSNLNFFEKSRLVGGERHPTLKNSLCRVLTKKDNKKSAKADKPKRT